MIQTGKVVAVDGNRVRVQVSQAITTPFLPVLATASGKFRVEAALEEGEAVAVFLPKNSVQGVVLGAIQVEAISADEVVVRSAEAEIKLDRKSGDISVHTSGKVQVQAAETEVQSKVTITNEGALPDPQNPGGARVLTTAVTCPFSGMKFVVGDESITIRQGGDL